MSLNLVLVLEKWFGFETELFFLFVQIWKMTSSIPAVEVDPAGCSYNPTAESHEVKNLYYEYKTQWLTDMS